MKIKPKKNESGVVLELDRKDEALMDSAEASASPFRIRNILVPIDFSECSKKALRYAIPFAKEHRATLTLLYVVTPSYAMGEASSIEYGQLMAEMRASGDRQLAALAVDEVRGRVRTDTLIRVGSASSEILSVAKGLAVDMVIISTHGYTGLKHTIMGSVAEHVVRKAPCPVLVVREREQEFLAENKAQSRTEIA